MRIIDIPSVFSLSPPVETPVVEKPQPTEQRRGLFAGLVKASLLAAVCWVPVLAVSFYTSSLVMGVLTLTLEMSVVGAVAARFLSR